MESESRLTFYSPKNMAAGRHMMVWVWAFNGADQWSTCFDVMISGSASNPVSPASSAPAAYSAPAVASSKAAATTLKVAASSKAPAAAVSPVQNVAAPVNNDAPASSPTPTPTPTPAPVVPGAVVTVTEWDTVWTTDYVVETARPGYRSRRHAHKRHALQL